MDREMEQMNAYTKTINTNPVESKNFSDKFFYELNGMRATGPRIYLLNCVYPMWNIPYVGKSIQKPEWKREKEYEYGALKLLEGRNHHGEALPGCRFVHQLVAHCAVHGMGVYFHILENPKLENLAVREEYYKSVYKSPLNEMEFPLLGKLK